MEVYYTSSFSADQQEDVRDMYCYINELNDRRITEKLLVEWANPDTQTMTIRQNELKSAVDFTVTSTLNNGKSITCGVEVKNHTHTQPDNTFLLKKSKLERMKRENGKDNRLYYVCICGESAYLFDCATVAWNDIYCEEREQYICNNDHGKGKAIQSTYHIPLYMARKRSNNVNKYKDGDNQQT